MCQPGARSKRKRENENNFFAADWLWNSSCCPPVAVARLRLAGALELSGPRWRLEALPHSEWAADWVQAEDEAPRSSLWRQAINGTAPALNCNNCTCESTQTDDKRTHTLKGELRWSWSKSMQVDFGGWLGLGRQFWRQRINSATCSTLASWPHMVISMVLATYMNTKMQIEATYFFVGQRFIPNLFNHMRDPNTKFHISPSKCFAFVGLIGINTKALKNGHWIKRYIISTTFG